MAWFKKTKDIRTDKKGKIPEGLWVKCDGCKEIVYKKEIDRNLKVCPKCNYHFRISARERLKLLIDDGSFIEIDETLVSVDPLKFKDKISYKDRLIEKQKVTGLKEAVISGDALIKGYPVSLVIMDFSFMGKRYPGQQRGHLKKSSRSLSFHHQVVLECKRGFFHSCRWQRSRPLLAG
jgi:acetyl-CoA carboxylase carboxyl transferase subunit beta